MEKGCFMDKTERIKSLIRAADLDVSEATVKLSEAVEALRAAQNLVRIAKAILNEGDAH